MTNWEGAQSDAAVLVRGARVIDPGQGSDGVADIVIRDGAIAAVGRGLAEEGATVIEAQGLVAAPGFIDLHAHLRDPGNEEKETIATGVSAAARGGFTTLCCMPNTNPAIDTAAVVQFILDRARQAGPVRVLPIGAITRGRQGKELADMEELARAGVAAFSDDGSPVADGQLFQMALTYAKELGLPVIDHCEDHSLSHASGINDGWVAYRLGLPGYPAAAEESVIARDIALAQATGGHFHAAHVSTAGGVELIRQAKARGVWVTAEATPHHLTMSEEWVLGVHGHAPATGALTARAYDSRSKVSPPLRTTADRDALVAGLREGVIDAIATDHAPHAFADKMAPFEEAAAGISVLETAFGSLMQLVHGGMLDLPALVHRLTVAPAAVLGPQLEGLATLRPGTPADLVLLDPNAEWTVDTTTFVSKGANTPLEGMSLKGRVVLTMAGGQVVHDGLAAAAVKPERDFA